MQKFWLLDQHDADGPTALVETNGSMHVVGVLRFGPGITELADQQAIHDKVIGKIAPTLKPLVKGASITVESVEPHADLVSNNKGAAKSNRADRRKASKGGSSGGRAAGGPSRAGGRGDR